MNKQQKLKKIIEYAIKRGWKRPIVGEFKDVKMDVLTGEYDAMFITAEKIDSYMSAVLFLFSHDFAEAVFGGKDYKPRAVKRGGVVMLAYPIGKMKEWQEHLQQAVITDPIDYYYKFTQREKK